MAMASGLFGKHAIFRKKKKEEYQKWERINLSEIFTNVFFKFQVINSLNQANIT
jgi:hypothetical protein